MCNRDEHTANCGRRASCSQSCEALLGSERTNDSNSPSPMLLESAKLGALRDEAYPRVDLVQMWMTTCKQGKKARLVSIWKDNGPW